MKTKKKNLRKPAQVYSACPACKSKKLIRLEVDVLCADCDWMSCEEFVEMGGMDNLFEAFREHFPVTQAEEAAELIAESAQDQCGVTELTRQEEPVPVEVGA